MNNKNTGLHLVKQASVNKLAMVNKRVFENKKALRLSVYLAFIWLSGLIPIISLTTNWASERIEAELQRQAEQVADQLDRYLNSYRNLPELVARLQLSKHLLPSLAPEFTGNTNRFLYQLNERMGCEAIYLLDSQGTVRASSDYQREDSIIGNNYSFRPYFVQAVNGERGHYFATDAATGKRGYFLSEPVIKEGQIIGVAVVKLVLEEELNSLMTDGYGYLLIGLDGVIFAGTEPLWYYRTLFPLPEERRLVLRQSGRYGPSEFDPVSHHDSREVYALSKLTLQRDGRQRDYLVKRAVMTQPNWHIFTFTSRTRLTGPLLATAAVYSLAFWLVVIGWLYWRKRLEIEQHAERMNTELESRVDALTRELKKSNLELQELVDHYRSTQKELEETQDQLVQTAKLAVLGEMSAGINHELSQPLLALQTYTENCGHFIKAGKLDTVADNLREMSRIVVNMGKIVSRFKVFSRRAQPELRPCPVAEIVDASLGLMRPLLKKAGVEATVEDSAGAAVVYCEPVQVEQVLINLISNAVEALADRGAEAHIAIGIKREETQIAVEVRDNGPGVAPAVLAQIFEPFYTTKNQGLGIGLALSKRIIETQSGTIEARPASGGGMIFTVCLPAYRER